MSDGGKGSAQRPTDHDAYANNFERIFRKKQDASSKETRRMVLGQQGAVPDQTESNPSGASSTRSGIQGGSHDQ